MTFDDVERAYEAASEQALVRAGWELVDVLGQLEMGKAKQLLGHRWQAERARAAATLTPLQTGPSIGDRARKLYEGPSVQTRYLRTLDMVQPGERVFEIGPGRGYLGGLILRDGGAAAYRGIDVDDLNLRSTREIFDLNGVADRGELGTGDLRDLTESDVEAFGTDLLVCCEVLEHVPDPEQAVKTLAAALPASTDLLISVPLLGRAEHVWGHISVFTTARIRDMIAGAGLVVHAVDVIDNTWVFVLVSHNPGPNPRAARAAAKLVEALPEAPAAAGPRSLQDLALEGIGPSSSTSQLAHHRVEQATNGVLCELTAKRSRWSNGTPCGGVRLPVVSPRGLRVQLALDAVEDVTAFYIDAYAGPKRVARWTWNPATGQPARKPPTFVVRRGARDGFFRPIGKVGKLESADAFDLYAVLKPGSSARFRVIRAATFV